jgi:hypothetical protein
MNKTPFDIRPTKATHPDLFETVELRDVDVVFGPADVSPLTLEPGDE